LEFPIQYTDLGRIQNRALVYREFLFEPSTRRLSDHTLTDVAGATLPRRLCLGWR
jgi:hypothetical protein